MGTLAVTGAGGRTGRAVIAATAAAGWHVRALVSSGVDVSAIKAAGSLDAVVTDLSDPRAARAALDGVDAVYHIGPRVRDADAAVGGVVAAAAADVDVARFVYHSILQAHNEAMPNRWRKLRVEQVVATTFGSRAVVLRPAPYVQDLCPLLAAAGTTGILDLPFSVDRPVALVDLADVARAAVAVLDPAREAGTTWDLAGHGGITGTELAELVSTLLGRTVRAVASEPAEDVPLDVEAVCLWLDRFGLPSSTEHLRVLVGSTTPLAVSLGNVGR